MMTSYFLAYLKANKVKTLILCASLALYLGLITTADALRRSIPEIARIPLKSIGVQTVVQKTGKIPERMVGAVFPHSNAPITIEQSEQLQDLPFVEKADMALYFWYFDQSYFKAVLGVGSPGGIFSGALEKGVVDGAFSVEDGQVMIADSFSRKHGLHPGDAILMDGRDYLVAGVLEPETGAQIIPADIYMGMADAQRIARGSEEMRKIYDMDGGYFGNVVLLGSAPEWAGDKADMVKAIDNDFLVFGERTFTSQIAGQLKLVSASGSWLFALLGAILLVAYGILTVYNLRTREKEIAILRMIGWRVADLKRQFITENAILLGVSLILGNLISAWGMKLMGTMRISMEVPWDISARPHFLPEENAINRVVNAPVPIHWDWASMATVSAEMLVLFLAVSLLILTRTSRIKPWELER